MISKEGTSELAPAARGYLPYLVEEITSKRDFGNRGQCQEHNSILYLTLRGSVLLLQRAIDEVRERERQNYSETRWRRKISREIKPSFLRTNKYDDEDSDCFIIFDSFEQTWGPLFKKQNLFCFFCWYDFWEKIDKSANLSVWLMLQNILLRLHPRLQFSQNF